MKRHGNLYHKITDYDNLLLAFQKSRKGKGWQNTIAYFEKNLDENLLSIQKMLVEKTYKTSPYMKMIIHEPKKRTIYKLPFYPDRIIHHALMNVIEPIWDSLFIDTSYACRKGKGLHGGSRKVMDYIRKNKGGYCLKMDISKFYPSVDHDILFDIVKRKIKCKDTLWLFKQIIYSIDGGKNVPIGNYTSQWLGNLYLNELDQYLKHEHRIKYYVRYCDDFVVIHQCKKYLGELREFIRLFIKDKLALVFSKCDLFSLKQGIDFLGYRHFYDYILLRKSTAKRIRRRLKILPKQLATGEINEEQHRSVIASISGWLRWANSYHLQNKLGLANV